MNEYEALSHTKWDCKYHVVFIPKRRKKKIFGSLRKYMGENFRELAEQKGCKVEEGHLMADHVHMCLSIPPKYAVSNIVGFIKGKSAITIARHCGGRSRRPVGRAPNTVASTARVEDPRRTVCVMKQRRLRGGG